MKAEKVVIVTGGARGIGRAVAEKLADKKTAVIITHVNPNSKGVNEALAVLKEKSLYAEAQCWSVDDSKVANEKISEIMEKFGRLDVLVNNAGLTRDNLILRMTDKDFNEVIQANLFGVFACSRAAAKLMIKQRSGRIINLTSIVAFSGNAGQTNYTAAKAGVVGFTKTLAQELAKRKITVNAVAPGFIETDMTADLPSVIKEAMLAKIPLGRFGLANEVAAAVAFLASSEAGYITGQTIHVNGGLYM